MTPAEVAAGSWGSWHQMAAGWCQMAGVWEGCSSAGSLDTGTEQRGPTGLQPQRLPRKHVSCRDRALAPGPCGGRPPSESAACTPLSRIACGHPCGPHVAAAPSPGVFTVSLGETALFGLRVPQWARGLGQVEAPSQASSEGSPPGERPGGKPRPIRAPPFASDHLLAGSHSASGPRPPPTSRLGPWALLPGLGPVARAARHLPPGRSCPSAGGVGVAPGPACCAGQDPDPAGGQPQPGDLPAARGPWPPGQSAEGC